MLAPHVNEGPTEPDFNEARVRTSATAQPMGAGELRAYEGLFLLLCQLRGASAESLFRVFFERALGVTARSSAMGRIERLVDAGFLRRGQHTKTIKPF